MAQSTQLVGRHNLCKLLKIQMPEQGVLRAGVAGWAIVWRTYLVAPVRSAELLDRLISRPRQLQRHMQAAPLVGCAPVRLQADASGGRIGDDRDQLAATLEGFALAHVDQLRIPHLRNGGSVSTLFDSCRVL